MQPGAESLSAGGLSVASLVSDLGLGVALLALDTAMTFLVVGRVVERQEEKKRRRVSSLAETRLLESLDALLADGLPLDARTTNVQVVSVGPNQVPLQVEQVDREAVGSALMRNPRTTATALADAIDRHGDILRHPLHVAILEPNLTPSLVRVITALDPAAETAAEIQAEPSPELAEELAHLIDEMIEALLQLRGEIVGRWR